ncbi:hypothetical protein [Chthoniobacter flavus]|uniref:hypothetical protein n=1 Tax=Chthoniobacter flavus TaxID=191863 RepID=UPI0012FA464C|nr:hypothetical protein [Chthoniobacter flavus]
MHRLLLLLLAAVVLSSCASQSPTDVTKSSKRDAYHRGWEVSSYVSSETTVAR